ncbi:hypothetical protein AAHH88_00260 [Candidatus Hodgkinia cicadicola]
MVQASSHHQLASNQTNTSGGIQSNANNNSSTKNLGFRKLVGKRRPSGVQTRRQQKRKQNQRWFQQKLASGKKTQKTKRKNTIQQLSGAEVRRSLQNSLHRRETETVRDQYSTNISSPLAQNIINKKLGDVVALVYSALAKFYKIIYVKTW